MWKLGAFGFKISTFPRLLVVATVSHILACDIWSVAQSVAFIWSVTNPKIWYGLVVKLQTMQQLTILVTFFFKSEDYSHRIIGLELV